MTVALAALCGFPNDVFIVAAEDHMITYGDIEFEQPQPKMWKLHEHCVAMIYGLGSAQASIAWNTEVHVAAKGITDIESMAESYAWFARDYVRRRGEAEILAPLGLKSVDLTKIPPVVNRTLLSTLTQQMQSYYRDSGLSNDLGGALIIGVDSSGPHIYRVEDGRVIFMDSAGFVAAGSGQWHAESQFMFSGYTRWWSFPDALSLLYAAKKRAEVAPGVGTETDLVIMGTNPPSLLHLRNTDPLVQGLEAIYQEMRVSQEAAFKAQHARVKAFIDDLLKAPPPAPPVGEIGAGEMPQVETDVAESVASKKTPAPSQSEASRSGPRPAR